jgi:hypothetical protein
MLIKTKNMKKQLFFITMLAIIGLGANAQWVQTNGPCGGQINCIAIRGNNIFAGTSGSGVYLSSNFGNSWIAANNGLSSSRVYALAINGDTIFAGTDDGVYLSTSDKLRIL